MRHQPPSLLTPTLVHDVVLRALFRIAEDLVRLGNLAKAALVAVTPPSIPWALRRPNSITSSPCAAKHTRAALVAMSVEKFIRLRSGVSSS